MCLIDVNEQLQMPHAVRAVLTSANDLDQILTGLFLFLADLGLFGVEIEELAYIEVYP